MPFRFTYGQETWTELDLNGRELKALEQQLGVNYTELQPHRSARHHLAILATFLLRTRKEAEVARIVDEMTLPEITGSLTYEDGDDRPDDYEDGLPKAEVPSTTTGGSASSPDPPTVGPQTQPVPSVSVT